MNIELFEKVKQAIVAEPERFDMSLWVLSDFVNEFDSTKGFKENTCGTTACIAGWACVLGTDDNVKALDVPGRASALLGPRWEQAEQLFYTKYWPSKFLVPYEEGTEQEAAQAAADAIDRFIACGGDWSRDAE
jgi:hypothetical protein